MKRSEMDIYFHRHMVERYGERMDKIDKTSMDGIGPEDFKEEDWIRMPGSQPEREVRLRGRFFKHKRESKERGKDCFTCIIGNLKVYGGFFGEKNDVYIITAYPFVTKMKKYMIEDDAIRFEDDRI